MEHFDETSALQTNQRQYKISLCTTCMGRLHDLKVTLPVNIALNGSYPNVEFVVLDYNSSDGVGAWIERNLSQHLDSGRLVYFRTEEPAHYSMTHSRNVAFKASTGDIVCNVDADNYTIDIFRSPESRPSSCFAERINAIANQSGARAVFLKDERMIRGRLGFYRDEFIGQLGGYDEGLSGYGYDDHDLCRRAIELGFECHRFGSAYYSRIETEESMKGANMADPNRRSTERANRLRSRRNIQRHRFVANVGREWGKATLQRNFADWITT